MNEAVFRCLRFPAPSPGVSGLRNSGHDVKAGQESQEGVGWLLIRKVMENREMKWDYGQV